METDLVPFMFRLDRKLFDQFKAIAVRERRSMTKQLTVLIEAAVREAAEQQKLNRRPVRETVPA